jgi:uncharacterized protein YjbI with pentapeptide repeats
MTQLLLAKDLRNPEEGSEVRTPARARTLTVLGRLDCGRKAKLLRFLYEADLINKDKPVVELTGVDASDADLSGAILGGADQRGVDLGGAERSCADRSRSELRPSRVWVDGA